MQSPPYDSAGRGSGKNWKEGKEKILEKYNGLLVYQCQKCGHKNRPGTIRYRPEATLRHVTPGVVLAECIEVICGNCFYIIAECAPLDSQTKEE